jgi:sugar/nucleoside kinase (ribokinase family)
VKGARVVGITGVAVEDTIEMPDGRRTEDRGGIYYAIITLSALAPEGTRIVPVLGIGDDAFESVRDDFARLPGVEVDGLVPVPAVNNKVRIRYAPDGSRTEALTGGVPPLPWEVFEPWPGRLDAWLWNMVSGMEVERDTFLDVKSAFEGAIHFDLHSLSMAHHHHHGAERIFRVPPHWEEWVAATTWVQLNEIEAGLLWDGRATAVDPDDEPELAARIHGLGPVGVLVTRGAAGAAYHDDDGRTIRLAAEAPEPAVDPTGCGDVFGAAWFALRAVRELGSADALRGAILAAGVSASMSGTRGLREKLLSARILDELVHQGADER